MTTDWYTYWKERGGLLNGAHRSHKTWNDYRGRGIYHITIVTHGRKRVFGELNNDVHKPEVVLSELGQYVEEAWRETFKMQNERGRKIRLLGYQVMPDHFHGIMQVEEMMDVALGTLIRDFKAVCTKRYRILYPPRFADKNDITRLDLPRLADGNDIMKQDPPRSADGSR